MRLFIISVLVLILFGSNCKGQGFYVENDTLHLKNKWVQPVEEEAKQRLRYYPFRFLAYLFHL